MSRPRILKLSVRVTARSGLLLYLAMCRAGPGFGPGLKKPAGKIPGPARLDRRAYISGPGPSRECKIPSGFGPRAGLLPENTNMQSPGPSRHVHRAEI